MKTTIQTIVVRSYDSSFGGCPYICEVVVKVDAKEWTKLRDKRQLGQLYGLDISNEVYRLTRKLIPAHNPSVSDRDRAKNGVKTIRLAYYFRDHNAAEQLGCEVIRLKNGECMAGFGTCSVVFDSRDRKTTLAIAE